MFGILIHSAEPQSHPLVITIFTQYAILKSEIFSRSHKTNRVKIVMNLVNLMMKYVENKMLRVINVA